MKTAIKLTMTLFGIILVGGSNCVAQTQVVTIVAASSFAYTNSYYPPAVASYPLTTNQVVTILSVGTFTNYNFGKIYPPAVTIGHPFANIQVNGGTYTGLTNISVAEAYASDSSGNYYFFPTALTISVSSPGGVVSNYVPADAIVIPASATGNVQIILESSPDLVNWTAAVPGTYAASTGTNRFFRVRAVVGL